MTITTAKGSVDTDKELVIFMFKDDDEMNSFLTTVAQAPVKTSGLRIITMMPDIELTDLQKSVLDILEGLDGIGGNDEKVHQSIVDDSVDKINNIIKNHSDETSM